MCKAGKVNSKRSNRLKVQRIQLIERDANGEPITREITIKGKKVKVNIPIPGKYKFIKHKIA